MLFDLFIKIWVTPENVIGLILNILTILGMCFIFRTWNEKWWKSLIPFYGTYLLYKHTWSNAKLLFIIPLALDIISARCMSFFKKEVAVNVLDAANTYMETEQLDIDINVTLLVFLIVLFLISTFISFLITRITYVKICHTMQIQNILLKIGTFLFPQIFLLIDYICYKKTIKDSE